MREFDFYIASWKRKTINIANYKPWAFGVRYVRRLAIKSLCEEHYLTFYFYKWIYTKSWSKSSE